MQRTPTKFFECGALLRSFGILPSLGLLRAACHGCVGTSESVSVRSAGKRGLAGERAQFGESWLSATSKALELCQAQDQTTFSTAGSDGTFNFWDMVMNPKPQLNPKA
jgi:hypothetical protein